MNLKRRLRKLERGFITEPIILQMPDGRRVTLRGRGDYGLELLARAVRGELTSEIDLVSRSASSVEPGGGHLLDLARAILNSPTEDPQNNPQDS
jgi:hypothetical protein